MNPDVKIILVTGDWRVSLSAEELQAMGADKILYLGGGPSDLRDAVLEYIRSSKSVPVSGTKVREYKNRDRIANLLRHDLSGKLGVLLFAEDAAHDSKTRLETAVREILAVFRIFDLEYFKARGGELFIPKGNSEIFAYSIPSVRSSKVYQTLVYGTMPRAQTFDEAALRQLAAEVGFDEIRNYFSKEIRELEGLRGELSKTGPLTPELRSWIVRVAHDILRKRDEMFGRWAGQAKPAVAVPAKRIEQILIVDDEEMFRGLLKMQLQTLKNEDGKRYVVTAAEAGQEALELMGAVTIDPETKKLKVDVANGKKFDLVITDLTMPNMSGMALINAMIQNGITPPVIVFSGYGVGDVAEGLEKFRKSGLSVDFLGKPFTLEDLQGAIKKVSGRSEMREDAGLEQVAVPAKKIEQVLVVDDDPSSLMLINELVKKFTNADNVHYVVSAAKDGREALELMGAVTVDPETKKLKVDVASGKKFDLVITDVAMPRLSGTELMKALAEAGMKVPVIFSTSYAAGDITKSVEELKKAGMNVGFLQKPITSLSVKAALEQISGRSEMRGLTAAEIRALEKRIQNAQETLIHPYVKGQRLIGVNALDVRLGDLGAKRRYIRPEKAFRDYRSLTSVLMRMKDKAATGDVSLADISEASELVGRLVSPPKFSGDKFPAAFLAALERVQQDLERWGKAKLDQLEAQKALEIQNSFEQAGEAWIKALEEVAGPYQENKPGFYDVVRQNIIPAVENWVREPRSPEKLAGVRKNGLSILEKWHKVERQPDGRLKDKHPGPSVKEDGLGFNLREALFTLWEELDLMVRTVEPSASRSSLVVPPAPAVVEPVKEEVVKKIVAAPPAKPEPVQLELFPRSEVRMPGTADFKQSEMRTLTAVPDLSVQPDMLAAVKDAGQTMANIQSPEGLAFFMKDGPTPENIEQAKLVIAHWLVQGLVAQQGEREISNKELRDQIEVLVKAAGKQIPAWKAPEDTFRKGAVVHSDLTFLDAAALEKLVADYFAVILGTLVRLDEKLVIHVNGNGIDAETIKALNAQVQKLAVANGIPVADRLQLVVLDERVFKNLKADAVLASEEGLKRITANRHLKSLWKLTDKAIGDTRLLAGDMATVLLAMLDPNIGLGQKEYSPESYSKEMLNTVLDALKAYESIKQAA
jgi:CheY-like chemotaxis protein